MFKTLQNQPRVVSLFCDNLENNRAGSRILQLLKTGSQSKLNVRLDSKFPTLDQLKYMQTINPTILQKQIPQLNELLKKKSQDSIFHSDLQECVGKGLWDPETPLWVDWERKQMGNNVEGIKNLLDEINSKKSEK